MKQVLIDTNILINSINEASKDHQRAKDDLRKLQHEGYTLLVCPQIIRECYKVLTSPRPAATDDTQLIENKGNGLGLTPEEAQTEIQQIMGVFGMTTDSNSTLTEWQSLIRTYQVKGKNAHDTHLVACMTVSGISDILTYNVKDFKRFNSFINIHS